MKITSGYGPRRITVNGKAMNWPHRGVDVRSPRGAAVRALWGGRVVKIATGRTPGAPIGRTDPDTGAAPLAASVSGNGTIIERDDGGYYLEVHMDPAVKVGDRVEAGDVIGHTDLSGQVDGAHRHIELWRRLDADSYYDPTAEVLAAASGKHSATPTEQGDDEMTPEQSQLLQQTAERVNHLYEALFNGSKANGRTYPAVVESLRTNPADSAAATLGAQIGRGARRRTIAAAIAGTESDAEAALSILQTGDDQ